MITKDTRNLWMAIAVPILALTVAACSGSESYPTSPSATSVGGIGQTAAKNGDGDSGVKTRTGWGDECVQPGSGYTDGPCNNEGGGNNGGNGGNGGSGGGGGEKVFDATLGWAGLEPYPLQSSIGTLIVGNMETCYTVGPTFAATNAAVWGANPPGEPGSFPLIAAGSFVDNCVSTPSRLLKNPGIGLFS